jgi:stage V sporulation protein G
MSNIQFTVEKMFCLPDAGKLKAFADVGVNDALVIKGVRVLEGKKGLFVSMPQEQGKDSKWYDQVVCKSAGIYGELSDKVIEHYKNVGKN